MNVPAAPRPQPPKPAPPQPVPQPQPIHQAPQYAQAPLQPMMHAPGPAHSSPPGMGRKSVNGMGLTAGIVGIVFGILHLGCGGILGVVASFVRDVQGIANSQTEIAGAGEFNGPMNHYFGYVHMSLGLMIFVILSYSSALIIGAVGLFKGKLWGWIVSNITAAIALLIAIFLFWGYMKTLSGLDAIDQTVDHVANHAPMDADHAEFAKDVNQMQRTQVHWSAWFVIGFYGCYATLVGICLCNPTTFRDYKSG